jgi:rare lipoprotein A
MVRRILPLAVIAPGLALGGCGEIQSAYLDLTSGLSGTSSAAGFSKAGPQVAAAEAGVPAPAAAAQPAVYRQPAASAEPSAGPLQIAAAQAPASTSVPSRPAAPLPHYFVGKPYQFNGVWYRPSVDYEYDESGIAALYDKDAQGEATTDGDIYDSAALTAAHKTLPLPSMVRVTNEQNGQSVEVRVNDRGPFVDDRIIALSQAAALKLGVGPDKPVKVRVQVMAEESRALASALGVGGDQSEEHLPAVPAPRVTTQPLGQPQDQPPATGPAKSVLAQSDAPLAVPLPVDPMPSVSGSELAFLDLPPVAAVPSIAGSGGASRLRARASVTPQLADTDPFATAPGPALHYVLGKPYQFDGVWYRPAADYDYDQQGLASVYEAGHTGETTTDGEIYDDAALSAAHKTLPLPSAVQVTNLTSGQTIELRVNDRGPFSDDRIIALSRQAASQLGIAPGTTAQVRVRILAEESRNMATDLAGEPAPVAPAATTAVLPAPAPQPVSVQIPAAPKPGPGAPGAVLAAAASGAGPAGPKPQPASSVPASSVPATSEPAASMAAPSAPVSPAPPTAAAVSRAAPIDSTLAGPTPAGPMPAANRQAEPRPAPARQLYIQAGSFLDPANAERARQKLAVLGTASVVVADSGGKTFSIVRIGPVDRSDDARQLLHQVAGLGYKDAVTIGN